MDDYMDTRTDSRVDTRTDTHIGGPIGPVRKTLVSILIGAALLTSGFSAVLGSFNQIELNNIQKEQREEAAMLEKRRFKAELRACTLTQNSVQGERRLVTRAMNVSRRNGTLTREALNFYRVSLKDLKVPSCTPTDLGFPQFDPDNLLP